MKQEHLQTEQGEDFRFTSRQICVRYRSMTPVTCAVQLLDGHVPSLHISVHFQADSAEQCSFWTSF